MERILLWKLTVARLVKFLAVRGTEMSITVFTRARH